jgi:hypothetical protein
MEDLRSKRSISQEEKQIIQKKIEDCFGHNPERRPKIFSMFECTTSEGYGEQNCMTILYDYLHIFRDANEISVRLEMAGSSIGTLKDRTKEAISEISKIDFWSVRAVPNQP